VVHSRHVLLICAQVPDPEEKRGSERECHDTINGGQRNVADGQVLTTGGVEREG
jgi:hypothetical protein